MSWSLQIDIPQPRYKAGDTVSGSVYLVSQLTKGQYVDVGSVTIELTGSSTTAKLWPRIPNPIRLFTFKKTLFTGPKRLYAPYGQTGNNDRNKWPISFTLPLDCSASQGEPFTSSTYFNTDPNQPLPISFVDDNVQGGSCSVVYELQATLMSPPKDGYYTNEGCVKKVEISVYRPRSVEQPNFNFNTKSIRFTHRSLLLLPIEERKLAHRPLTLKEKLKLKPPSTEHLPRAVFEIRVQTPSTAVIGQALPLMLHVDYDSDASTVPPPIFHLKKVTIHLKKVTIHLCEETSIWGSKRAGGHESTRWTKEITLQEKEFDTRKPRVEEHLDLKKVMNTVVHNDLTPTFKTFNIARTYSLKVFVRLECAGKEHFVFGDYKRCTLLAEQYDPQTVAYNEPAPVMDGEDTDPPPPYHFATQEAVPEYSTQAHCTGHHGQSHAGQNGAAVLDIAESSTAAALNSAAPASSAATP
ncbi:hypothetical protein HO133_006543 [Letharia lupina]|uniref:Arrestin-like N-terminal domain-containing protein n=1 Tax=Letharia lupina TaxID=560253 RepID=A0A8H6F7E3_9LECA|nr:uncharacterized protein HO133_006543 [Letharia lupina]KAF6217716.1 hypothetical protein HO133_006543 [Letharia lupina]